MPVEIRPARVHFGKVHDGDPTQYKIVTLLRGDGGPITPKVSPGKLPNLYAQVCEIEPGEHYELELSLSPPMPGEKFRDLLRMTTGVEEAPSVTLWVTGDVTPRLSAMPGRITFPVERTEEVERLVRLKWDDDKPSQVLEATTTIPDAKVTVRPGARMQTVVVTMPAGSEAPAGKRHSMTIKTADPKAPSLNVPITFRAMTQPGKVELGTAAPFGKPERKKVEADRPKVKTD